MTKAQIDALREKEQKDILQRGIKVSAANIHTNELIQRNVNGITLFQMADAPTPAPAAPTPAPATPASEPAAPTSAAPGSAPAEGAKPAEPEAPKLHLYRKSAWTEEQYNNSNEREFDIETQNPTRYQFPPGSFTQTEGPEKKKVNLYINPLEKYPLKLDEYGEPIHTISYFKEYIHKDHAWTGDYYNVAEFEEETRNPTIDYKALGAALAQV